MASRSLGTLTLDLIARIGGFTGPMDQASRASQKRMAEIKKSADAVGKAVGTAFAAVPAIVTGLVTSSALAAKEITNLSKLAGLSATEFQRYAAAASTVGIEQDKLSDIFKDTNDKVGDFLATGGGELKNFFEIIAPKVGVTAEQFRKLNSADALQLYVKSLEKANVSQAQMTFFMEAIADEATALVPLLSNGGKKFKELGDAAQAAGMVMDEQTISSAGEFSIKLTEIGQYASSAKTALAAEFMPVLAQLAKDFSDTSKQAGGLRNVVQEFAGDFVEVTAISASLADGIGRVFKAAAYGAASSFSSVMAYFRSIGATANTALGAITFGDTSAEFKESAAKMSAEALINARAANTMFLELAEELDKPWAGDKIRGYVKEAKKAAAELRGTTQVVAPEGGFVGQTDAQKAAAKSAEAAAKKISQAFESTEEGYQRQIELINTTSDKRKDATEVEKLAFEVSGGKLKGINSQQQKRLEGLAAELDALKKIQQAEEDGKKLASFRSSVNEDYLTAKNGFDQELAGAGQGDKYRERLQERLAIEEDFNRQRRDLVLQHNTGDLSDELFKEETKLLGDALAARLELQNSYYSRLDEAQSNWMDGVSDAWQNFADQAQNYSALAADATTSVLGSARSELSGFMSDVATNSADAGDALMDMITGFAKAGINALADMAAQWLIYQAVQMMTGKAAQTSAGMALVGNAQATAFQAQLAAYASTAAIPVYGPALAPAAAFTAAAATAPMVAGVSSAALMGMAHDGIDNIPREGTWLLDGGERVLNPNQNRDLTQYLRNAADAGSGGGRSGGITINAPITVQAQPGMSDEAARRQAGAISESVTEQIRDVIHRETQQGGLLWRR